MTQTIRQRAALRLVPRKSPIFAPRVNSRTSFIRGFRAVGWIIAVAVIISVALLAVAR